MAPVSPEQKASQQSSGDGLAPDSGNSVARSGVGFSVVAAPRRQSRRFQLVRGSVASMKSPREVQAHDELSGERGLAAAAARGPAFEPDVQDTRCEVAENWDQEMRNQVPAAGR